MVPDYGLGIAFPGVGGGRLWDRGTLLAVALAVRAVPPPAGPSSGADVSSLSSLSERLFVDPRRLPRPRVGGGVLEPEC